MATALLVVLQVMAWPWQRLQAWLMHLARREPLDERLWRQQTQRETQDQHAWEQNLREQEADLAEYRCIEQRLQQALARGQRQN